MGRFINADKFASTGQGFLGCNMFAYCNNNPVNVCDPSGELGIAALCFIGGFAGAAIDYATQVIHNYQRGMTGRKAWLSNIDLGSVVSSAFSGALSAIPGAGIGVQVLDMVGSTVIEHGVNYVSDVRSGVSTSLNMSEIATDLVANAATSIVPVNRLTGDLPQFIRHIKSEARAINIKGTRQLTTYLNFKQATWIATNTFYGSTLSELSNTYFRPWVSSHCEELFA